MTKINIIVAASENDVIGKDNDLPWKLPQDLMRFKRLTSGHIIVMGRKCYESIGRLLPKRTNVILTRQEDYKVEGATVCHDIESALAIQEEGKEIFIIGGSDIYRDTMHLADRMYLTRVHAEIEGDVHLEGFDPDDWYLMDEPAPLEENGLSFTYLVYEKTPLTEKDDEKLA